MSLHEILSVKSLAPGCANSRGQFSFRDLNASRSIFRWHGFDHHRLKKIDFLERLAIEINRQLSAELLDAHFVTQNLADQIELRGPRDADVLSGLLPRLVFRRLVVADVFL